MQSAVQVLKLAQQFTAHAYKVLNGVHQPRGSHAPQQHSTNYIDLDGSE